MTYTEGLNTWLLRAKAIAGDLSVMEGRKYDRIVKTDISSRYSFCFIEKATGNVMKSASWNKPAPTPRGNIYKLGLEGVDKYGAYYRYR